jgi:hypothetical protein
MHGRRSATGVSRRLALLVVLAVASLTAASLVLAHASGLSVTSGGITVKDREYGSPVTCTLTASADTYVRSDQAGSSFGTLTTLDVNAMGSATRRSLVAFDLTACSPDIPSDAIVHSATVRLTTSTVASTSTRTYDLYRATSSWTESTTWTTQPSVAGSATSSVTIPALTLAGTTFEWTVARDVQAFVAGDQANLGWRLNDANEGALVSISTSFSSREAASNRPQLVVTFAP